MTIEAGQTLLHFRLVEKIGEGGMGVVWKATDTSLERDVAIKILPAQFSSEPERLARFEREARVLASLNHPHIAGVYGLHEADGHRFIAMEFIPGEDLADAMNRGRLPAERVLQIMREVAEALEVAHESGVIHRDLKPANVRLNPEGKAKVLDFGLAKAYDPATASDPMTSQTMTSAGTVAGLILGTASYMSPEQASGQPTDRRADILSFGVMLHEMLSGKRLFEGETVSHTLADVLRAPISMDDIPADVPPSMSSLVDRCLTRDKMRRLRDIGEARIAIENTIANPDGPVESVRHDARKASRLPWIVAGLALLVAVVAIGFSLFGSGSDPSTQLTRRFTLEVPNTGSTRQGAGRAIAVSPDGTRVLTLGGAGADDMLYMRQIDAFDARPVEGTVGGGIPLFSPDGQWIGFRDTDRFAKIRTTGGPAIHIGTAPAAMDGVTWGSDDHLYFSYQGELFRMSATGTEPAEQISRKEDQKIGLMFPSLIPDTGTVLCSTRDEGNSVSRLVALDIATKQLTDLEMGGTNPRYLPTGKILFVQRETIVVAPFDPDRLEITGPPAPVLPRAWVDEGQMQLDISSEGSVVYLPISQSQNQSLMSVDLSGQVTPLFTDGLPFKNFNDLRLSRDGRSIAVSVEGNAIWMVDLDTQTPTKLSESGFYPLWSPDGSELIYGSARSDSFNIYRRPVDLSRPEEILLDVENNLRSADWTRQGALVVREQIPEKGMDLHYVEDVDQPSMVSLMDGDDDELAPIVSYDGQWLAYVSDYSGTDEIYVTSFPDTGARHRISTKGGTSPTWAPDGKTVYYLEGATMVAVSLEFAPRFRVTGREPLFDGAWVQYRWSRQYDIHPDGDRFLMVLNPPRGNVEVITNWFQELDALARTN